MGNLGENAKNVGNQGGNEGNQGGNLSIAAEMTCNSNWKDKFKEWREVKVIEINHIFKNLVSHIWYGAILVYFEHYWFSIGKYRLGKLSKMEDLCHFYINSLVLFLLVVYALFTILN